ncbi:uncharacterized protein ALTATR162_LOCUS5192 [Alternaria atra]|uniref:Brefeldin A resistance protein n=1 Tax=Alternaria atra TaxID=119953 RepID=A0A8J2MZQ6_9PLEO|nr:uncharacterized protein ALTATR162_LOCUS5192 [Alternaria atra]CAG5158659.1 unnamed protein product [Alternaria atra]
MASYNEASDTSATSNRQRSHNGLQQQPNVSSDASENNNDGNPHNTFISNALHTSSRSYYGADGMGLSSASSNSTVVASPDLRPSQSATKEPLAQETIPGNETATQPTPSNDYLQKTTSGGPVEEHVVLQDDSSDSEHEADEPSSKPTEAAKRPGLQSKNSKPMTEDDLFRALSRRRTSQINGLSKTNTGATGRSQEEEDEINNLMSKMFGHTRQEASEEEKTRHQGVVFKHLMVKGMGIGAALQPSVGSLFLDPVRFVKNLLTKGPRQAAGKPPVRTLLDDFSGCIRPGEMVLVLGRPGAGCSTFLKMIGNQRYGFEEITGDVSYGGTDAEEMGKKYRSEVLYNPEEDLHYATLKVKDTLRFALKTRTPGKESRKEGESRKDYVNEFLRVVTKLFWIEHTLGTKVDDHERQIKEGWEDRIPRTGAAFGEAFLNSEQANDNLAEIDEFEKETKRQAEERHQARTKATKKKNFTISFPAQVVACTDRQFRVMVGDPQSLIGKWGGIFFQALIVGSLFFNLPNTAEGVFPRGGPPHTNPAEYMLEAIGAGNPDYKGQDWGDVWEKSSENEKLGKEIQDIIASRRDAAKNDEAHDDREYAMPYPQQWLAVVKRSFVAIWRDPPYVQGMVMLHIITGLFNGFTFWDLGNSQIDMQSRLFSIFMTLTIAPPLIQQLQPRFISMRGIYESREGSAKIYSWTAMVWGTILSELPYRIIAGTIYWCCWYFPPGFPRDTYTAASVWLFVMLFEVFYLGFGQAIASFSPNELLASLLVPLFFTFIVSFCGVVVPYASLPTFWQSWMYFLTPFRYLLEGFLALLVQGQEIRCETKEMAIFPPPPGQDCQTYAGQFAQQAGGYVEAQPDGNCGFCQYATGESFLTSFNVFPRYIWRDFGIMWAYIFFNFAVVFICTWLYLGGLRQIKSFFSPAARKQKKETKKKQSGDAA